MKWDQRARVVSALCKEIKSGKLRYDHKFQRRANVWNNKQKSLLIDSIIRGIPIDPIKRTKDDSNTTKIIDGIQRMSTIYSFINNEFKLSADLKPITIDDVTYEIASKKYSDLEPELKESINQLEVVVLTVSECTDTEERIMFQRWNNGSSLTSIQLRNSMESDEVIDAIYELISMPFFEKIMTKAMLKSEVDKESIRQTFMLISLNEDETCNFTKKSMDDFIKEYKIDENIINTLKRVLTILNDSFADEKKVKIARTSIAFILYAGYRAITEQKSTENYVNKIKEFINNYDENEEYKSSLVGGTTKTNSVMARLEYFNNIVDLL